MKPNVYRPAPNAKPQAQPQPRPQFTLVPGQGKPPRGIGRWLALGAVLIASGAFFMMRGQRQVTSATNGELQNKFLRLEQVFRQEGMLTFLQAKARLKLQVADALKDNADDDTAQQIAVYLFPELLPDDDFEKIPAGETWSRMEAAIEGQPRSNASRTAYLELQNQIWQYETAEKANPALTPTASAVLRIYRALSAP